MTLAQLTAQGLHANWLVSCCAGVVTTAGTVVARVLMGQACDKFGPRYGKMQSS